MLTYSSYLQTLEDKSTSSEYKIGNFSITAIKADLEESLKITLVSDTNHLILHWGIGISKPKEWKCPLAIEGIEYPSSTVKFDEKAAQTPFSEVSENLATVQLQFSKAFLPTQVNFVIKRENTWYNNNNSDYSISLKEPSVPPLSINASNTIKEFLHSVIECEVDYDSWTLMHRFNLCSSWLPRINNTEGYVWVYIWMRYSALRKLDWQRRFDTRPKDLASSQKNLTFNLINLLRNSNNEGLVNDSMLIRGILGTMGRGGDNGQRIRDEILFLMHRGGIREHNPGLAKSHYYEQWHQKLHNNTTPDDIGIAEALIAFNETNDMKKYWEVLTKHGITKERLASFDRPLTKEPFFAPQIVPDLYNYLALLKAVHGSNDLSQCVDYCKGFLSPSVNGKLQDVLKNLQHWDKINQMERVFFARKEINSCVNKGNSEQFREIVYLDMALESYTRQLCEEIFHIEIDVVYLFKELVILLENIKFTSKSLELSSAVADFLFFYESLAQSVKNNRDHALILKAACDRIQRLLGTFVDVYNDLIDSKAKFLGNQFLIDKECSDMFTEEVIRGSLFFAVSIITKKIDSQLRKLCGLKSWQIISPRSNVQGFVIKVDFLHTVAFNKYTESTIIVCDKVTGEEEIPEGVVAVVCCTELDALAHVSVRARNNKVLLAICFDEKEFENILSFVDSWVKVSVISSGVSFVRSEKTENEVFETVEREVKEPKPLEKIAIQSESFGEGKTGAKANNCAQLKIRLPTRIGVPSSIALPYGVCEYILSQPENLSLENQIKELINELQHTADTNQVLKILQSLKSEISNTKISENHASIIRTELSSIGCSEDNWSKSWTAIKSVWASKFNERVYLSILKSRINYNQVVMSVLCQQVVSGDYAYVLHTKNPMNNNSDEIYGEVVLGLGETLVGAYEGRALSFIANKSNKHITIESFPNKSVYLKGSGFIFRSDSNSEDLPGFAGAGLFDSFLMDEPESQVALYSENKLLIDSGFREFLLQQLREVGILIEEIFCGVPQDIEGVVKDNKLYVVQSRPQV